MWTILNSVFFMSLIDQSSFLCLILDVVSLMQQEISVEKALGAVILYCNSFLLMHRHNRLVIMVVCGDEFRVIYPPVSHFNPNLNPVFHELSTIVETQLLSITLVESERHKAQQTLPRYNYISNAFSKSLTIINKQLRLAGTKFKSRIFILQFDRDRIIDYNSLMNSIFSAQKLEVTVDALIISKFESHIFQQACFLTGGLYLKHRDGSDMLQILNTYFLSDGQARQLFNQPLQKTVDFKASCFCHKSPVEYAYMCSVCLTLLCDELDRCPVCNSPSRRLLSQSNGSIMTNGHN